MSKRAPHLKNYRAFRIHFIGSSNTKGSRIKIIDERLRETKTFSKHYDYPSIYDEAYFYLKSLGIPIVGTTELASGEILLLSTDFRISIKGK